MDLISRRGIGFIMPNKNCEYPVMNFACTIDSVESVTGIDFFQALSAEEEQLVEKTMDVNKWVGERELGDTLPLKAETLPRNTFNTVQALLYG